MGKKGELMDILRKLTKAFAVYHMTGKFPSFAYDKAIKEIDKLYKKEK